MRGNLLNGLIAELARDGTHRRRRTTGISLPVLAFGTGSFLISVDEQCVFVNYGRHAGNDRYVRPLADAVDSMAIITVPDYSAGIRCRNDAGTQKQKCSKESQNVESHIGCLG
jgi:hypothetical protein